ncbi:MAG: type VI secretion system-associated FHA domain protein TagH [Pseudomonadota bacterium]
MALTLRIENFDYLDDGGPIAFPLTPRACQVGRSGGMDWILPDPTRHLSGHHFNVTYRDGAHWLEDVSTNGTFLQGQRYRLDGPHRLQVGDRFQVGQYIIAVTDGTEAPVGLVPPPAAPPAPQTGAAWGDDDPWAVGAPLAPVDPLPPARPGRREDFADGFIESPSFQPPPPQPPADQAGLRPLTAAPRPEPSAIPTPIPSASPPPADPSPAPAKPASSVEPSAMLAAFCQGAGLDPASYADADPEDLMRQVGAALRAATVETMDHLRARAAFKEGTRHHVERTMAGLAGNPLKTAHHPDKALEELFFRPRAGATAGAEAVQGATRDLRLHHAALIAALQPALGAVLHDLAPEAIEGTASGGLLGGSKRAKAWETFVDRWDAKAAAHENGMLDEFFKHLSRAYADALKTND